MKKPEITKFERFAEITLAKYERYLPTAFDESLTLLEKMNKLIHYLNEMGLLVNDVVEDWNKVMEWVMSDGLTYEVRKKLEEMYEDGRLETILAQLLLDEYATKKMLNQLENDLTTKINKNEIDINRVFKFNNEFINISDYEELVINNDWTPAFNQAIDDIRVGGTLKIDKSVEIFNDVIVDKQINIIGTGYHHNPNMYKYATLYIGRYCKKGLVISEHSSTVKNLNIEGVASNISNGLTVVAARITVKDVSIHKMGGHGLLVGNTFTPMNLSLFNGVYTTSNNKDGIHLNYGDELSIVSSDLRACTFMHIDTRSNNGNGLFVGNAHDDTFVSITAQENKGYGVLLSGRSGGHKFYTLYSERNKAFGDVNPYNQEVLMEEGSRDNYVDGERTGIQYKSILDLGNNIFNYTSSKKGSSKTWNYLSADLFKLQNKNSGIWLFENTIGTDLDIRLDGTSAPPMINIKSNIKVDKLKLENSKYLKDYKHISKSVQLTNLEPKNTLTLEVFNNLNNNSVINFQVRSDNHTNDLLIQNRKSSDNFGYIDITNIGTELINSRTLTLSVIKFDIEQ